MAAVITIRIEELSGVMSTSMDGSIEGASKAEVLRALAIGRAIGSIFDEMSKPTPGCNCPACKASRQREAEHERPNMH